MNSIISLDGLTTISGCVGRITTKDGKSTIDLTIATGNGEISMTSDQLTAIYTGIVKLWPLIAPLKLQLQTSRKQEEKIARETAKLAKKEERKAAKLAGKVARDQARVEIKQIRDEAMAKARLERDRIMAEAKAAAKAKVAEAMASHAVTTGKVAKTTATDRSIDSAAKARKNVKTGKGQIK